MVFPLKNLQGSLDLFVNGRLALAHDCSYLTQEEDVHAGTILLREPRCSQLTRLHRLCRFRQEIPGDGVFPPMVDIGHKISCNPNQPGAKWQTTLPAAYRALSQRPGASDRPHPHRSVSER